MSTIKKDGNLRLNTIVRFTGLIYDENDNFVKLNTEDVSIKDGLAIEYCYDGEHYLVVAFIYYNVNEGECFFKSVLDRVQHYITVDDYQKFVDLLNEGFELVIKHNMESEDEDSI